MFKNKLQKFIFRKVLILFFLLSILSLVFMQNKLIIVSGILLGTVFSLLRFSYMGNTFYSLLMLKNPSMNVNKSILRYIILQLFTIVFLVILAKYNILYLVSSVVGILSVSLVVVVNSVTEGLGITKNNFE